MAVTALLFVPWLAHLAGQVELVQGGFWIERPSAGVFWDIYQGFLVYAPLDHGSGTNPLLRVERWLVLGLLVLAVIPVVRSRLLPLAALTVVVPLVVALSVSVLALPIFVLRYLAFALGAFWTVVVAGLLVVPRRPLRWAIGGFVLVGVAINLAALYLDPYYGRSDLRGAAAVIEANWRAGDLIVHTSEFSAVPFDYYFRGRLEQVLLGAEDDVALRTAAAEHERLWVVRDFGLLDPTEGERASQALPGLAVRERFDLLGVYVFLAD
jgi:hypothetical protein